MISSAWSWTGTSPKCPGVWLPLRLLPPRRPAWGLHVRSPLPSSSPTSLTTSMRATRLFIWLPRHSGGALRSSWWRTEPIAEREIAEAHSRFTTLRTRTDGIRRHRLRRSGTCYRLAPIQTPWIPGAWRPCTERCERGRWRQYECFWMAGRTQGSQTSRGRHPCTLPFKPPGEEGAVLRRRVNNRPASSGCCWNAGQR